MITLHYTCKLRGDAATQVEVRLRIVSLEFIVAFAENRIGGIGTTARGSSAAGIFFT